MEPIRRTNMPRPRSGLSEIARFDFDNASILRGGARRRADTNSSGSASQHNAPKRSNPFSLSFTSGPAKALSNIFSNKRRKKHHTSAGPEYGFIPDNQARSYRTATTSKDAEELKLYTAQESVKEPTPPEQYPIFTFGQQQPEISTQTQFTFGPPPPIPIPTQPKTQARPGRMKQAQRGLAETARQMFKPAHSKKDSKDLMRDFDPRLNGDVEITTSVYGPLQHDGSNNHTHGHSHDGQNTFLDQVRQAGSMLAGKRKDERERSTSRSRKRARDQSDSHDLEKSEEVPPIPPGFIGRTTSISVDTHVGLETEEYSVPPPHVYQTQQQQPPAPVPVMPDMSQYHPYMTGQYFQTAYQNFYDPHAIIHAFGEQAGYLAQHQSHQLPPIAEDELAEREEEALECLAKADDKHPSESFQIQHRDPTAPAQTLHDEGVGHSEQAGHKSQMNDDERPSPGRNRYRTPDNNHNSIHEVSSMDEDYNGTRSPVSSLSDAEMANASDDELSRKDRVSLAANQRAIAELDDERERLRRQFEKFSWCHGQEEEFGAYTLAADRESTFLN